MENITPPFATDGRCIGLMNLHVPNLPETIEVQGHTLLRKEEFHITLMCPKNIAPVLHKDKSELVRFFVEYAKSHDLTRYTLLPEYRLVKKEDRITVVVMVDMPALNDLFAAMNAKYGANIPTQPAHITIFGLQTNWGIGINSPEELQQISTPVEVPFTL
ncbi:MAG TPA: hypothetical protein VFO38_04305 [Candidatus Saccharimonadales bacterium]|nr:hypothetical protein [Candidatus Saccharimonadales bacterium]